MTGESKATPRKKQAKQEKKSEPVAEVKKPVRRDKKNKEDEVKVALYDSGAIQRALDDILVEYLFGKCKNSELAHDVLPLVEVTWHKDVRIAASVVATVLAVWLYYRAATAPRWMYVGGLVVFAVLYLLLEGITRLWLRDVLCVTKEIRSQNTHGSTVVLPALRIGTGLREFSADYVLEAEWGKGQSCRMEGKITDWIDLDGVVHKELFLKEVKAFLTRLVVSAGGRRA